MKVLLKSKITRKLKFVNCSLSCSGLIDLSYRKFPSFIFPNAFIILDGDVKDKKLKKVKNILLLSGKNSPERLFAEFLYELDEESLIWENINRNFTKQYCFREIAYNEIMRGGNEGRTKAKEWYKSHKKVWGRNATKVINPWIKENKEKCDDFVNQFIKMYNKFAKELSLDEIPITKK